MSPVEKEWTLVKREVDSRYQTMFIIAGRVIALD